MPSLKTKTELCWGRNGELIRETRSDVKAWACAWLKKLGFKKEKTTRSGSRYFVKINDDGRMIRVRVSDHHVPETDERSHNVENGGFSWASCGHEIICGKWTSWIDAGRMLVEIRGDINKTERVS